MAWWRDFGGFYPPSRPRAVRGGIKAQSKRGTFGESWWAKRWIQVLESFDIGARLGRGRSYARQGQVLGIAIGKGTVSAEVQGSRPKPYQVRIKVPMLSGAAWNTLAEALGRQALFAAKLVAGEMPEKIEGAFQAAGLSLFPTKGKDLQTECSCPDWSNPCKHIAAVYYLLGEEFDRDPFLIFKLRGMEREELLRRLGGALESKEKAGRRKAARPDPEPVQESPPAAAPLPPEPESFWGRGGVGDDILGEARIPSVSAALPKRLGKFPLWRGEEHFADVLDAIYQRASRAGMDVFLAEAPAGQPG